jgi:hypothetical protein
MQNNNIYKDLSRIGKLRTSPFTNTLSLCQECYYNKILCRYAYKHKLTRLRADLPIEPTPSLVLYCYGLCKPQIPHQQSLYTGASFRLIARIITIITPLEESRPANTRLQRQHVSTTLARVYNASTYLQRQRTSHPLPSQIC